MRFAVVLVGAVLMLLSACGGVTVTSDVDRPDKPISATAYSEVDGVETWDLTGEPSEAAFGIDDGFDAIYETPGEPRAVRILLPDRSVELDGVLVTFTKGRGSYSFAVRTAELEPTPLAQAFRDVLRQLEVDESPADTFAREVAAAPRDQPERIEVGAAESIALGRWSVGPAASIAPLAGSGRVIFSGTYSAP